MRTTRRWCAAAWLAGLAFLLITPGRAAAQGAVRSAFGDPSSGSVLQLPVLQSDPDPARRAQAAGQLGRFADGQAIPALAKAAAFDPDRNVRIAAGDAIALIRQLTHQDWIAPGPAAPGRHERMVRRWYWLYLHRAPDEGGFAQWVQELNRGIAREQVQATLLASDEYFKMHGSLPGLWIANLYADVLGRSPAREEVRTWLAELNRGVPRDQLALGFLQAAKTELANRRPNP